MSCKNATYTAKFSTNEDYTLTTSFVASDAIALDFAKKITIFPYYTATAATNVLTFTVEVNPYNAEVDADGDYWTDLGSWVNSSGTYAEEISQYVSDASAGSSLTALKPLNIAQFDAQRIRITAKETVNAGTAGSVRFVLGVSNDD